MGQLLDALFGGQGFFTELPQPLQNIAQSPEWQMRQALLGQQTMPPTAMSLKANATLTHEQAVEALKDAGLKPTDIIPHAELLGGDNLITLEEFENRRRK